MLVSGLSYILGYKLTRNPAFRGLSILGQIHKVVLPVSCGCQPLGTYTNSKNPWRKRGEAPQTPNIIIEAISKLKVAFQLYQVTVTAIPNYHRFTHLLSHSSVGQKSGTAHMVQLILYLGPHKAEVKVSAELPSFVEALCMNPLPNSFKLLAECSSIKL